MAELIERGASFFASMGTVEYIIFLAIGAAICYLLGNIQLVAGIATLVICCSVYARVEVVVHNGVISFIAAFVCSIIYVYISFRAVRRANMIQLDALLHDHENPSGAANIKTRDTGDRNDG